MFTRIVTSREARFVLVSKKVLKIVKVEVLLCIVFSSIMVSHCKAVNVLVMT